MDFDVNLVNQGLDTPAATTTNNGEGGAPKTETPIPAATATPNNANPDEKPVVDPAKPAAAAEIQPNPNEAGAANGQAAAPPAPASTEGTTTSSPASNVPTQDDATKLAVTTAQQELFKALGVSTLEELQERLKPKVEETPEQIADRNKRYSADLDAFAIKNNLITRDEIVKLETLKQTDPQQIVFSDFAKTYKEANAEATPEQVTAAFRLAYHLDSETPSLKTHGESLINRDANAIVKSLESKYTSAKETFDSEVQQRSKMPAFKSLIKTSLDKFVPPKLELDLGGDQKVSFDIDPSIKAEIEKFLVNNQTFEEFNQQGSSLQMNESLKARIDGYVFQKNRDAIFKTIFDAGKATGLKQGSTTGAQNPFPLNASGQPVPVVTDALTPEDVNKVSRLFG